MIKNENYIQISGWMLNELNLSGNELIVYALIHGFSQDGKSVFKGSISYIQKWLNCGSKQTVISVIKKLIEKKIIEKKVVYNGKNIVGCEYWTAVSRQRRDNKQSASGTRNRPPLQAAGLKNELPLVQNLYDAGLKNELPSSLNSGHNMLNSNSSDNDVVKIQCEKVFGVDFFESGFNTKATTFLKQHEITGDDVEEYFLFVKNTVAGKYASDKINNGLYYKFIFENDIVEKFKDNQKNILLVREKEKARKEAEKRRRIICPVCGESFLPDHTESCPQCEFAVSDFEDEKKIERHKKYMALDRKSRDSYDAEFLSFKSDIPLIARLAYFNSPQGKTEKAKFIAALDKKYGFG